jgi:hypothetical protein
MKPWHIAAGAAVLGGIAWLFGTKSGGEAVAAGKAAAGKLYDSAAVKAVQAEMNALLLAAGQKGVTVDGKAGAMTCRAAEWLVKNVPACPQSVKDFAVSRTCGSGKPRAPCGIAGPVASDAVKKAILDAAEAKGYPRADVNKALQRESGWHPQALNCQGADKHPVAGGLMQMLGSVLTSLGFEGSADQFAMLSGEEQLPYCIKFIQRMPPSTLHLPGDFGLALFTPAYVGKPDDFVIYEVNSSGWVQNPGLRSAGGGPITAGSVRATAR